MIQKSDLLDYAVMDSGERVVRGINEIVSADRLGFAGASFVTDVAKLHPVGDVLVVTRRGVLKGFGLSQASKGKWTIQLTSGEFRK